MSVNFFLYIVQLIIVCWAIFRIVISFGSEHTRKVSKLCIIIAVLASVAASFYIIFMRDMSNPDNLPIGMFDGLDGPILSLISFGILLLITAPLIFMFGAVSKKPKI